MLAARPASSARQAQGRGSACCWSSAGSWRGCATGASSAWPSSTARIAELLVDLNQRPFKKLPGCRASAFEALDAPALKPLPATRYEISRFKRATRQHRLPRRVRWPLLQRAAQARGARRSSCASPTPLVAAFAANQRVACHARSAMRGAPHHRGRAHAGIAPRAPGMDARQAHRLGPSHRREHRAAWCAGSSSTARTPSRATAPASDCKRLARQYGPEPAGSRLRPGAGDPLAQLPQRRLDPAVRARSPAEACWRPRPLRLPAHENVRGPDYYH